MARKKRQNRTAVAARNYQSKSLPQIAAFVAAAQPAFQLQFSVGQSQTSSATFLGDPSSSGAMTRYSTANAHSLSTASGIVHPLHRLDEAFYQLASGADVYRREDSGAAVGIAAVEKDLYVLGQPQKNGNLNTTSNIWSEVSAPNGEAMPAAKQISTAVYPGLSAELPSLSAWLAGESSAVISSQNLSMDAEYQTMHEIPSSSRQDYQTGCILANSLLVKSFMDSQYTMNHSSEHRLRHSRVYDGIGSCGSRLYLTYRDNASFDKDGKKLSADSCSLNLDFPSVETVERIRRQIDSGAPKRLASLYSVEVHSPVVTALRQSFSSDSDLTEEQISSYIQRSELEIKTGISQIAESVQPAQLQLFDVKLNEIS